MHTYIHAYIHTYIHIYGCAAPKDSLPTLVQNKNRIIHTYTTYIHTYIHTCVCAALRDRLETLVKEKEEAEERFADVQASSSRRIDELSELVRISLKLSRVKCFFH